jgi:tetratricopeptide (TPR) repeat protein
VAKRVKDIANKVWVFTAVRTITLTMAFIVTLNPFSRLSCEEGNLGAFSEEITKGEALYAQGRLWDSLTCYKRALAIKPDAGLYFKIGQIYMNLGETPLAEEFFLQTIGLDKEYATAYKALGELYVERGQEGLAREAFEKAEVLFSKNGATQEAVLCKRCKEVVGAFIIGQRLQSEKRPEEGLHYYEFAAEHTFFKYPQALYKLGKALADCGHRAEAVREYKAALSLRPEYKEALYELALTYKALGRYRETESLLREVIQINPRWPIGHIELAKCLEHKNRSEATEEFYKAGILFLEEAEVKKGVSGYFIVGNLFERIGDLITDKAKFANATLCLKEIKRLHGKSSTFYKKLHRSIYQNKLKSIGQPELVLK